MPQITIPDDEPKWVCHICIGDPFLANKVKEQGTQAICSYCGGRREALPLEDLADRTHEMFQEHFELTPSEPDGYEYMMVQEGLANWYREGTPAKDVITEIAGVSEAIAEDITEMLSNRHGGYRVIKHGGIDPYDSEAQYEESNIDDEHFRRSWRNFRNGIQSRSRFFSPNAEEILNSIFGDLTTLKAHGDKPAIVEIGPGDADRFVWRARTAYSIKELETILEWPTREIGPPPSKLTPGGRMNAQGIPVLYGALDAETCISEIRPPVGSYVAVAKFEFIRPVRVLDLDVLANADVTGSFYDPDFNVRLTRATFLSHLVREVSRPVMPQDEAFEYLATQVVAEYLANKVNPRIDGVIFRSSQTGGTGRNVVLFNHACEVEPYNPPPKTKVTVNVVISADEDDQGDEDLAVTVLETVHPDSHDKEPPARPTSALGPIRLGFEDESPPYGEPTLRMDLDSIVVLSIKSVDHNYDTYVVKRYRDTANPTTDDSEDF